MTGRLDPEPAVAHHSRAHAGFQFACLALMAAGSFFLMREVPLSGDEASYANGAATVAGFVKAWFTGEAAPVDANPLMGQGWFMPGMSVLLAPVYLASGPEPALEALRGYVLALNVALLAVIIRVVHRRYRPGAASILLALALLSPSYLFHLSTLWADLVSVHVAILFLLWLDRDMVRGVPPDYIAAGLAIGVLAYLRPLYPAMVAMVSAAILLMLLRHQGPGPRTFGVWALRSLVMFLLLLGMLSPWSQQMSARFGPTLTITSAPMSLIILTGSEEYLARANSAVEHDNLFYVVHRYIQQQAARNRVSFREQAGVELDAAREEARPGRVFQKYAQNVRVFYWRPNQFPGRYVEQRCAQDQCLPEPLARALLDWNTVAWGVLLAAGFLVFVLPMGVQPSGSYLLPFLLKGVGFLICLHPLMVLAHGRYFVQLVPLIGLAVGLMAHGDFRRLRLADLASTHGAAIGLGQLLAVVFAVISLALALLSAAFARGWPG